jgi:hypothetical protein
MSGIDGALARKLDFGEWPTTVTSTGGRGRAGLRLASRAVSPAGPDKYRTLEARRRAAQIKARHLLDLLNVQECEGK